MFVGKVIRAANEGIVFVNPVLEVPTEREVLDIGSSNRTFVLEDQNRLLIAAPAFQQDMELTVPNDSTTNFPIGTTLKAVRLTNPDGTDSKVEIIAASGVTVSFRGGGFTPVENFIGQNRIVEIVKIGNNAWFVANAVT